ncbi:MAG: hypothetical protein LBU18_07365 [Treponema sp.]|nr:hypothetical protein [Treponema sp.]
MSLRDWAVRCYWPTESCEGSRFSRSVNSMTSIQEAAFSTMNNHPPNIITKHTIWTI